MVMDAIKGTAMYDNLKSLGITNPDEIDRYSLRQEANKRHFLKIYFQKDKGEFFKSVKFKIRASVKPSSQTVSAKWIQRGSEISPNLRYAARSMSSIDLPAIRTEIDLKRKILDDLRHRKAWSLIRSAKSKRIWKKPNP